MDRLALGSYVSFEYEGKEYEGIVIECSGGRFPVVCYDIMVDNRGEDVHLCYRIEEDRVKQMGCLNVFDLIPTRCDV